MCYGRFNQPHWGELTETSGTETGREREREISANRWPCDVNRLALAVWNKLLSHDMATVQLSHKRYKSACESCLPHDSRAVVQPVCGKWHLWVSFVTLYSRQVECEHRSAITLLSNVCTLHRRAGNISYKWLTFPKALWDSQEIILCICNAYIEFQAKGMFLWFCFTSYSVVDTIGKLLWNGSLSNFRLLII